MYRIPKIEQVLIEKGVVIFLTELKEIIWQRVHFVLCVECDVVQHLSTQLPRSILKNRNMLDKHIKKLKCTNNHVDY